MRLFRSPAQPLPQRGRHPHVAHPSALEAGAWLTHGPCISGLGVHWPGMPLGVGASFFFFLALRSVRPVWGGMWCLVYNKSPGAVRTPYTQHLWAGAQVCPGQGLPSQVPQSLRAGYQPGLGSPLRAGGGRWRAGCPPQACALRGWQRSLAVQPAHGQWLFRSPWGPVRHLCHVGSLEGSSQACEGQG